ncbi:MAG: phenylacetic acid degradation bifunctional protein PaaZ, partial [Nonlabens sp.]
DYENGKIDEEAEALVCVATILTMVEKKQTVFPEITESYIKSAFAEMSADSKPQWGTMTPQHMVEHLEMSYRIASGEIQDFEVATPDEYLEKIAATLWNYDKMPQNHKMPLMKDGELEDLKHEDLETAKSKMLEARNEYLDFYKKNPKATTKNAVFGELSKYEWCLLERKHVYHHLSQFGLID